MSASCGGRKDRNTEYETSHFEAALGMNRVPRLVFAAPSATRLQWGCSAKRELGELESRQDDTSYLSGRLERRFSVHQTSGRNRSNLFPTRVFSNTKRGEGGEGVLSLRVMSAVHRLRSRRGGDCFLSYEGRGSTN